MTADSDSVPFRGQSLLPTTIGYVVMVLATIAVFFLIRSYGETAVAPVVRSVESSPDAPKPADNVLLRVLVALTAVIVVGQVLAKLFAFLSQPPVIGEVVAGILLGPSLLGQEASAVVLPPSVAPYLGIIAQLGVTLYMFLVGLDLNLGLLRERAHATVAISHASIVAPFILGSLLALLLYPRFSGGNVPFTHFALFLGVAMSITAFPVLARILTDYGMTQTKLGVVALSCAAIGDVTAWCLLAFVVGVAKAQIGQSVLVAGGTLVYIALMFLFVRPMLGRFATLWDVASPSRAQVAAVFIGILLSAVVTEAIGIHAIFGAFLLGAVIPRESAVARAFTQQLEHIVTVVLLPAFFAFTGMRTRIDLVSDASQWLICGLIMIVATLGKFGGTVFAARLTGLPWRDSAVLGTLMNTRGLMELIVLNIGLELKVISPTLFAMMVLMALATTMATSPILRWLMPRVGRLRLR